MGYFVYKLDGNFQHVDAFLCLFGLFSVVILSHGSVWNNHAPDRPRRINSAAGEHISSPSHPAGRVKISSEKNLDKYYYI
jgi:hypothetical protein